MDFRHTEEQRMLRETVRRFTEREVKPIALAMSEAGKVPPELIRKAADMGLFGILIPEEHEGAGAGETGYCILIEEISRGSNSFACILGGHQSLAGTTIILGGTEEQKRRWLPPMARGELLGAFALTEPNAGSDAGAIETTAREDAGSYVLSGTKIWVTNGDIADLVVVFALTDRSLGPKGGITCFLVEKGTPGFRVGTVDKKMGLWASSSAELVFEEARVPKANVLGKVGEGFRLAMETLTGGRLGLAAGCLGSAKEVLSLSMAHATARKQFGRPIAEFGAIQWMLADMAAEIYAMESLVYRTAWMADSGQKYYRESAIAKMYCSEAADRVIDRAVQIHGGMGYMRDYPVEMFYRDARVNRIFEGTNEIQRLVIARDLLKKGSY